MSRPIAACILSLCFVAAAAVPARAHCQKGDESVLRGDSAAMSAEASRLMGRADAESQYRLGFLYETGAGVPLDVDMAADWYRRAAEQGHAGAQFHLGRLYEFGDCEMQSYETAAAWYAKAAVQGNVLAQNALGYLYMNGDGVPQDAVTAYAYFDVAAGRQAENAAANRDELAKRLTPAQLAQAKRMAQECAARDYMGCAF